MAKWQKLSRSHLVNAAFPISASLVCPRVVRVCSSAASLQPFKVATYLSSLVKVRRSDFTFDRTKDP